jgi:hypothetical protein
MNTLAIEKREASAETVSVTEDTLTVNLADGRTLSVPLAWYPRLLHGSSKERSRWRLIGKGEGIHWADLDEDISVESLLFGHPSGESQESFKRWLTDRKAHPRSSSRRPNPPVPADAGQKRRRG